MKKSLNDYMKEMAKPRRQKIQARAAEIIAEEMTLQELRKAKHKSQQELAKRLHVKQAEISKMERRTDMYVSTLRNFVQSMGGTLDIIAQFPDKASVRITQFETIDSEL
jgi:transcriptional regulator with XRE-family HTH domain